MANITELKNKAAAIKSATVPESVSASQVGGLFEDVIDFAGQAAADVAQAREDAIEEIDEKRQSTNQRLNAIESDLYSSGVYEYGYSDISTFAASNTLDNYNWNVDGNKDKQTKVIGISYKAKAGTTKFYKVTVGSTPANSTFELIAEVVNTAGEDGYIKTIDVNVELNSNQVIAISGALYFSGDINESYSYKYTTASSISTSLKRQIAYKTIGYSESNNGLVGKVNSIEAELTSTSAKATSALAKSTSAETSLNELMPAVSGGYIDSSYGYNNIAAFANKNDVTAYFWNVDHRRNSAGTVTKINYKAKEGTISFYKVTVGASVATTQFELITTVTNTSAEDGTIKTISINVSLESGQYIAVTGSIYFSGADISEDFDYYYIGGSINKTSKRQIAYNVIYHDYYSGLVSDVNTLKNQMSKVGVNKNLYVVDSKGNGNFRTIKDALVGTYGKDSKDNPITIKVNAGTYYVEPMTGDFNPYGYGRHLSIIGEDKVNTIIISKNSFYYPHVQDGSCIKVAGNVYIANLTLIASDEEYAEPEGGYTDRHYSYCIHVDSSADDGDTTEIHNCRMINYHNCCIGAGIKKGQTLKITDCEMYSEIMYPDDNYGNATVYAHDENGDTSTEPTEHLYMKNCAIESNSDYSVKMLSVYDSLMKATFINNVCNKAFFMNKADKITLTDMCSGNNKSNMNK